MCKLVQISILYLRHLASDIFHVEGGELSGEGVTGSQK